MSEKNKPVETLDALIERLGGNGNYVRLWDEILKDCERRKILKDCEYRDGVVFYKWSPADTFQLPLIRDFIREARLRPADAKTLAERLDCLVFEEIDKNGDMFYDAERHIVSAFKSKLDEGGVEVSDDFPWEDVIADARDMGQFRENIGGLMHDTKVPSTFVLATPDEARHADTLNEVRQALYGDEEFVSKHNPDDAERERNFWSNSVSWLVGQQGYDICDLFSVDGNVRMEGSKFLQSVLYEFSSAGPGESPCLAVLADLTPAQLVEVLAADDRNIEFPKDVSVGLYDQKARGVYDFVSSHGGFFMMELEKPLVVPKELVSYIDVETPDRADDMKRAEAAKCGVADEAWKSGVVMTDAYAPSIAEMKASLPLGEIQRVVEARMEQVREDWEPGDELERGAGR